MIEKCNPSVVFRIREEGIPLIDVRSPAEYRNGHIPGALNLPLFSDEERRKVGTLFKQKGRESAMDAALELLSPKALSLVKQARTLVPGRTMAMYCWRGGMRSGSLAWLLNLYGFKIRLIEGGYKNWRSLQSNLYQRNLNLLVIAGQTGSGKTQILHELAGRGEQVIDLEGLANHRGSAFGSFGLGDQPRSEHFTNLLFEEFMKLDLDRAIWIEDESLAIGRVHLPHELYHQMAHSTRLFLKIPRTARAQFLESVYGFITVQEVEETLAKISKRMGGQNVQAAIEALKLDSRQEVIELLLAYYDKGYAHSLGRKMEKPTEIFNPDKVDPVIIANSLLEWKKAQGIV